MSLRRTWEVFRLDLRHDLRRPLFWFLVLLLAFLAYGLSTGHVHIASGSSEVGGKKAWITSEFTLGQTLAILTALLFSFFIAVAGGMVVIRDEETKVGELLHSTPLRVSEYVWGKFLAVLAVFVLALALQLGFHAFCNHVLTSAESAEFVGPFSAWNYVRPALVFALPTVVFFAGTSFALGAWTRRPILVFVLPVAAVLTCGFFLWEWSPSWLDPRINRALMFVDPAGFRWLDETWLKVDRGVAFYNQARIGLDPYFLLSRLAFVALGLLAVFFAQARFASTLRGHGRVKRAGSSGRETQRGAESRVLDLVPMSGLGMTSRPPGLFGGTLEIARVELKELRAQPGLYLFVPLILLQIVGTSVLALGAFDTPLLVTSGLLAVKSMNTLTLLVSLLLLFYMTESLERERARGLAPIHSATPARTASILLGKALANSFVGIVILLAAFLANAVVLLIQGKTGIELRPFLVTWVLLLVPTFVMWCAFVAAVHAMSGNRYATYAVGLSALTATGWFQLRGKMNWVANWDLWNAVQWSDLGTFELLRRQLWLNRLLAFSLAALFLALAVRFFPRRGSDAANTIRRLHPRELLKAGARLSPWLAAPLFLGIWLWIDVRTGFQGEDAKKRAKDYWAKNIATWKDAPSPSVSAVDLDLVLDPARHSFTAEGTYTLTNDRASALRQIPVTRGFHWKDPAWTLDGEKVEPEDRAGLCVFTPKTPLAPGASLKLGFKHAGAFPDGATKNGGGTSEFILPSGIVLTSFGPGIVPMIGFMDNIGVDEDNHSDAKVYPDDFYEGITDSAFGNNMPCTTRVRVTAPAEYTINSVGALASDEVADGKRTVVWESDHPVNFFNVVAGRWDVRRGEGTAIYYHPGHPYNIDEMLVALDGARRWFSEWFRPYPWKELKLSEFPGLAGYAQGFPTNITFSENIGFLTKSEPKAEAAFMVTAHESAHQWWGNILVPGKGPGGDILSEGMSHFSTILLMGQVKGLHERVEFCKQLEARYGDRRQVDSEKPLVKIDNSRAGDETVTYDKGGWVFWMLLNRMGREQALAGLRTFIRQYENGPDHPVLQDFVATMRGLAPDKDSYEDFVNQWFFDVVVPEYRLADVVKTRVLDMEGAGGEVWEVRLRVTNAGTGRMPLEIAAARGERFLEEPASPSPDAVQAAEPASSAVVAGKEYRDARTTITLAAGESEEVVIRCDFEPDRVLVDPDALVLQLQRKLAIHRF